MAKSDVLYIKVAGADEIPNGGRIFLEIGSLPVVLMNIGGNFYAIADVCTHDNGPLGDGELDGFEIVCPRHGARFDVRTGAATKMPAVEPVPFYPIRIVDEMIEIGIPKTGH